MEKTVCNHRGAPSSAKPSDKQHATNKIANYSIASEPYSSNSNLISLLLLALVLVQDATGCLGSSSPQLSHVGSHFSNNDPIDQSVSRTHLNWRRQFRRQLPAHPLMFNFNSLSGNQTSPNMSLQLPFFGQPSRPSDSLDTHIANILVPRVSGTQGNIQVRNYIRDSLKSNGYHVELDEFKSSTPVGEVMFSNIIASSNPNACRQLVLACHYDSKMMDGFLGAIDSAVPCAMLLKMSETFKDSFRGQQTLPDERASGLKDLGLRFIFFDGEEAYVEWTPKDSLYGSRHLAERWAKQAPPKQCANKNLKNELERIELFVLLDLIGSTDTSFVMYNRRLRHHYEAMQRYEKEHLSSRGLSSSQIRSQAAFRNRHIPLEFVEDDHVPFMRRGVPILSLLAHPFPKVWHTVDDNYEAIDFARTRMILHVLEKFVSNYSGGVIPAE